MHFTLDDGMLCASLHGFLGYLALQRFLGEPDGLFVFSEPMLQVCDPGLIA
jgi:hypothetical protein